jgi:hypothetical protein
MRLRIRWAVIAVLVLAAGHSAAAQQQHKVLVTFNYNFTIAKGCKEKETGRCVKRFIIYDITDRNHPQRLFSIAVPANVRKTIYQIKGKSDMLPLPDGLRTFSATAQWADGTESERNACTATATVGNRTKVSVNLTPAKIAKWTQNDGRE